MSILLFIGVALLASIAGYSLVSRSHFAARSKVVAIALAVGFAPLLAGLLAVAALWLLPGASHATHLGVVVGGLILACSTADVRSFQGLRPSLQNLSRSELISLLLLLTYLLAAAADTLHSPLSNNDALEYATVARALYETRDLRIYPLVDAAWSASGFYAPWTHPPLYVALGYLADVLQGNARDTELFRLISAWCLIGIAAVMVALARNLTNNRLLPALMCVATPMLYLGATAAQIDTLPTLAFAVTLLAFIAADSTSRKDTAIAGLALGVSMWTHSQAVIFPALLIPLLFLRQVPSDPLGRRVLAAGRDAAVILGVALVVAAAPYVRNIHLFGSPISDNPPVFSYEPLGWTAFFKQQRGLVSPQEIIEFGILKGFFALEIFSMAFWLALLSTRVSFPALIRCLGLGRASSSQRTQQDIVIASALAITIIYLVGTAVSVFIGTDVMIRNERYMLVLMPCVTLLAVVALDAYRPIYKAAVTVLLGMQLISLEGYRLATQTSTQTQYSASDYLRENTPVGSIVFALRPADMFYAERPMISYLDPRLLAFYSQHDVSGAIEALRALHVRYIQVPDYALPPLYNSLLEPLLLSPRYSTLVYDSSGYQIYSLNEATDEFAEENPPSVPIQQWTTVAKLRFGSSSRSQIKIASEQYSLGQSAEAWNSSLLFRRATTTSLVSGPILVPPDDRCADNNVAEYVLALDLTGEGFVQVAAKVSGTRRDRKLLGGVPLFHEKGTHFARRFQANDVTAPISFELEMRPITQLSIVQANVRRVCARASSLSVRPQV